MEALKTYEQTYQKAKLPQIQSGDTVRVHQMIVEGSRKRVQMFEGVVIRLRQPNSVSANFTVRRIASGVGVERTYLMHSPNVQKIEVIRRGKVARNFLSYLRGRAGKSARLTDRGFDSSLVNLPDEKEAVAEVLTENSTDEQIDAAVTEISTDEDASTAVDVSTEELAKDETTAAESETPSVESTDEQELPAAEAEAGEAKAAADTDESA